MKSLQYNKKSSTAVNQAAFFQKNSGNTFFGKNNNQFFSPSSVQAKLMVNQPNDPFEKEADTMADKVVQRLAEPELISNKRMKIQAKPLSSGITTLVQAKCASCEEEDKLQQKEEEDEHEMVNDKLQKKPIFESNTEPTDDVNNVQRKCVACESAIENKKEEKLQRKDEEDIALDPLLKLQLKPIFEGNNETLGDEKNVQRKCAACEGIAIKNISDQEQSLQKKEEEDAGQEFPLELQRKPIFESNAEPPEDSRNVQRKCAVCESASAKKPSGIMEEKIQRKSDSNDSSTGTGIENKLNTSKGSGAKIPASTKEEMENSFGVDFSNVRLHTDSTAVQMSKDLNAQAFTHGNDIYFNSGKYDAKSDNGKFLLAHELTHTLQQGSLSLKPIMRKKEIGENAKMEILENPPPQAELIGPYNDETIAGELYGDQTTNVKHATANPSIILVSYPNILSKWKLDFAPYTDPEEIKRNADKIANELVELQKAVDTLNEEEFKKSCVRLHLAWKVFIDSYPVTRQKPTTEDLDYITETLPPAPENLPEEHQLAYGKAIADIKTRCSIQYYHNNPVLKKITKPKYQGPLSAYILSQKENVAWVIKDTIDLVNILSAEKISEDNQWKCIGLLRQHMNPYHFAFMVKVVEDKGLMKAVSKFSTETLAKLLVLVASIATIQQLIEKGIILEDPNAQLPDFKLNPDEEKVMLIKPGSPIEISQALYGDGDAWQKYLVPYNRGILQGINADMWMPVGTELFVDSGLLVEPYKTVFVASKLIRENNQEKGTDFFIRANPSSVAVPGNEVDYSIAYGNIAFQERSLEWWVENDPWTVKEYLTIPETFYGPTGKLYWANPNDNSNVTWNAKWSAPGNHVVKCKLTDIDNNEKILSYKQTVLSLEEKTEIEFDKEHRDIPNPATYEEKLKEDIEKETDKDKREMLEKQLEKLKEAKKDGIMYPLKAIYVSEDDQPVSIALHVYTGMTDDIPLFSYDRYNLRLWDFTMQGAPRTYFNSGHTAQEALEGLLETFADDAPYPDGLIKFQVSTVNVPLGEIHRRTVVFETDGGMAIDDLLGGLSTGAFVIGVGAALLGQAEIAIPAFYVASIAGGLGAAASIYDRLEHGDFEWNLETGMNVLDIVGAALTLNATKAVSQTVKGVGKLSILGKVGRTLPKSVDVIQIGVTFGVHLAQLNAAAAKCQKEDQNFRDCDEFIRAFLSAVADGALYLIVHRAGKNLEGKDPKANPDDPLTPRTGDESDAPGLKKDDAFSRWEETLNPETRKRLAENPEDFDLFYNMDPKVRRLLTACRSDCIPRGTKKADVQRIQKILDELKLNGDHMGMKEYLYDHRDNISDAITEMENAIIKAKDNTVPSRVEALNEFLHRYISSTARGGIAIKVGDQWVFTLKDGTVVTEYQVMSYSESSKTKYGTRNFFQAHHGIQNGWASARLAEAGYTRGGGRTLMLRDSFSGSPHQIVNGRQNRRGTNYKDDTRTYETERQHTIEDLQAASVPPEHIDNFMGEADAYFGELYNNYKEALKKSGASDVDIDKKLSDIFGGWKPSI